MPKRTAVFKGLKAPSLFFRLLFGFGFVSASSLLGVSSPLGLSERAALASESVLESKSVKADSQWLIPSEVLSADDSTQTQRLTLSDLRELSASDSEEIAANTTASPNERSNERSDERLEEAVKPFNVEESMTLAQVTSVSELSDVQPGDWAFTALQRLVEEYGCLEGYPDSTYRGNRALTRYEFAAGLNACLDVVIQLISNGDLDGIRRLQEEFAAELAVVRSQVDTLELDVAELEANQFSTTTKFSAQLFGSLNYATAGGDVRAEGINVFAPARDPGTNAPVIRTITDDPSPTFSYYTWLNFTTSFTGEDRLQLQLTTGDGNGPANFYGSAGLFNTFGVPFTLQTGTTGGADNLIVREVFYDFPVGDKLSLTVGPAINWYRHFDNNRFTFYLTGANSFNSSGGTQVNAIDRGAGAVAQWDLTDWMDLRVGYLAENTEFLPGPRSAQSNGLFAGTTTLTGQLGLSPTDNVNLRFLYTRSNLEPNAAGFVGGAISEPIYGFADDGFGGPLQNATADTFLFNFDWLVAEGFGLFGRYSYGSTNLFPISNTLPDGQINAQSIQVGMAFPNLFKEGAQGIVSYVQPFDVLDGRNFLASGGGDGAVQQEIEVAYRYPLSPNIALVPAYYYINNVNNFGDNPDVHVFSLQTQFSF
ncbi:MAG: iron uptake porin [Cyanobacteria bacterium J06627_28]